jgi:hypothetical protein
VFTIGGILMITAVLLYAFLSRKSGRIQIVSLSLICGGGIGNLIDRVRYDGHVTDFLNMGVTSVRPHQAGGAGKIQLALRRITARRTSCRGGHESDPVGETQRSRSVPLYQGRSRTSADSSREPHRGTPPAPVETSVSAIPTAHCMTTLLDIVRDLRSYDEKPVSWQEPTIYAEEPWATNSQAIVCWSPAKGGLPDDAAKLRLVRLVEVRSAVSLLADKYDQLARDRLDELCVLLIARVQELPRRK